MKKVILLFLFMILFVSNAYALNLSRVKTWSISDVLTAADLNAEFDNVLNHAIANADISATAAIVASKIDFTTASAIGSTTPSTGAFTTLSTTADLSIGEDDTIIFEGATADAFETTVTVVDPTADRTATLPNLTGTVVLTTGSLTNVDIGAYEMRAQTLESDVTTGTAPLAVASTTVVANLNVDQVDGKDSTDLVLVDGSQALTDDWDAGAYEVRAQTFESDVTTGTAPLVVASTTVVTNLNADLLDGQTGTYYTDMGNASAGTLARGRGGTGITTKLFNVVAYTGNGVDDRDIAHGLGTTPSLVMIFEGTDTNSNHHFWVPSMSAGWSKQLNTSTATQNAIQSVDGTNVQIGTDADVNDNGVNCTMLVLADQ